MAVAFAFAFLSVIPVGNLLLLEPPQILVRPLPIEGPGLLDIVFHTPRHPPDACPPQWSNIPSPKEQA
ncbi:MAG: hypothetical protein ABI147_12880 [Acidobacteriaceae bacterium]